MSRSRYACSWSTARSLFELFFEDKRYTTLLLTTWMIVSCIVFYSLGAFRIQFMTFGPSEATVFMGMPINTWSRWSCLAWFSFTNTAINVFLSNALGPWMQNTIQDHKCKTLPYSKLVCLIISQMECIYSHIMGIFSIFLFFSQIDFLLIRTAADLLVDGYSTIRFMKHKTVNPNMYSAQEIRHTNEASDKGGVYSDFVSPYVIETDDESDDTPLTSHTHPHKNRQESLVETK